MQYAFVSQVIPTECLRKRTKKHFILIKVSVNLFNEINQDTPASSALQFEEPGLKRNISIKNKLSSSKIKRRRWNDDYIKQSRIKGGWGPRAQGGTFWGR